MRRCGCKWCPKKLLCPDAFSEKAVHCGNYDQSEHLKDFPHGKCSVCESPLILVMGQEEIYDREGFTGKYRERVLYLDCPECEAHFVPPVDE